MPTAEMKSEELGRIIRTRRIKTEARAILQRLHDYIELRGFNISIAWNGGYYVGAEQELLENARKGNFNAIDGEVCFIGGARLMAGVDPDEWGAYSTAFGDGPELQVSLEMLDEAAVALAVKNGMLSDEIGELKASIRRRRHGEFKGDFQGGPGKIAESYGFAIRDSDDFDHEEQKPWALEVVRGALRIAAKELGET